MIFPQFLVTPIIQPCKSVDNNTFSACKSLKVEKKILKDPHGHGLRKTRYKVTKGSYLVHSEDKICLPKMPDGLTIFYQVNKLGRNSIIK